MAMRKKNKKQKAFEEYQKKYIGKFLKGELTLLLKKHQKEIDNFRKEWRLTKRKIKTAKDYQNWLKEIEKELKDRKFEVAYFEEEEGHTLKGYDTVAIELFTLMEESPRITPQGDSLKAVFDYRFRQLMRKLGIDPDWYGLFLNYIFTGEINLKFVGHPNIEVTERFIFGPENDEIDHRISLNIGPNTRKEEIDNVWKFIVEPLQKTMKSLWKGKIRKRPTHKIALKMLKLKEQGLTISQIIEKIDPEGKKWDIISAQKAIERVRKRIKK